MTPDITLGSWFAKRAAATPDARALTFEGATLTYRQMLDRVDRLAAALREGGVCRGDRVAFLGLNHPAFFETMLAAARLGAIFVPLNFRLTGPELSFVVDDAGVHTLVVDPDHKAVIDSIRGALPVHRYVVTGPDFEALVSGHQPLGAVEPGEAESVAVIMYTSGTTGRPKGAMLTHANLWWNNTNLLHMFDVLGSDVTLVVAPLFRAPSQLEVMPTG